MARRWLCTHGSVDGNLRSTSTTRAGRVESGRPPRAGGSVQAATRVGGRVGSSTRRAAGPPGRTERTDDVASFENAHDAGVVLSNELALDVVCASHRLFSECTDVKGNVLPCWDTPAVQPGAGLQIVEAAESDIDGRIGEVVDSERRIASHPVEVACSHDPPADDILIYPLIQQDLLSPP